MSLKTHPTSPGPSSKNRSIFVILTHCCINIIGYLVLSFLVFLHLLSPCTTAERLLFPRSNTAILGLLDQTCEETQLLSPEFLVSSPPLSACFSSLVCSLLLSAHPFGSGSGVVVGAIGSWSQLSNFEQMTLPRFLYLWNGINAIKPSPIKNLETSA